MADNIYSIESSRDENLERMIYDITGAEVESKVEKFREEYQYKKENDSLNKLIRGVVNEEKVDESQVGRFVKKTGKDIGGSLVKNVVVPIAKEFKYSINPRIKAALSKTKQNWKEAGEEESSKQVNSPTPKETAHFLYHQVWNGEGEKPKDYQSKITPEHDFNMKNKDAEVASHYRNMKK